MHTMPDFSGATWFKSSRSDTQNACVEAAHVPGFTGVQDTKQENREDRLVFTSDAWSAFIDRVKSGQVDL